MRKARIATRTLAAALAAALSLGCAPAPSQDMTGHDSYTATSKVEIAGRQGIAADENHRWVSDSGALYLYDAQWNLLATNDDPFATGILPSANHISDIDVHDGKLYCGIEHFQKGQARDLQIAVYDAQTLDFLNTLTFNPASGQDEVSGMTVNPEDNTLVVSCWSQAGTYLYRYDLASGTYKDKVRLDPAPGRIQGVAYHNGAFYLTSDDGDASNNEPDHVYRATLDPKTKVAKVTCELTLNDVERQGEVEGLSFDESRNLMLVLYNRGAIIVDGDVSGFYDSYDHEFHEVVEYLIL